MNPKQVWDGIRNLLLAAGVSGTVLSYISDEVGIAIGGLVLTVGIAVWQIVSSRTAKLIEEVAKDPEVAKVVVHDPFLADEIPTNKVIDTTEIAVLK